MTAAEPDLLRVERPLAGVAVVTLNRPDAMNALSRALRQALHAARVTFPHPSSGALVTAEAPLPSDMR